MKSCSGLLARLGHRSFLLLALAGCADLRTDTAAPMLVASAAPAPAPADPLAAFAATAAPGSVGQIVLAGGQPARVRLARAYFAASGRECREVLVGIGLDERSEIVCQDTIAGWTAARPLLRTGPGSLRPVAGLR